MLSRGGEGKWQEQVKCFKSWMVSPWTLTSPFPHPMSPSHPVSSPRSLKWRRWRQWRWSARSVVEYWTPRFHFWLKWNYRFISKTPTINYNKWIACARSKLQKALCTSIIEPCVIIAIFSIPDAPSCIHQQRRSWIIQRLCRYNISIRRFTSILASPTDTFHWNIQWGFQILLLPLLLLLSLFSFQRAQPAMVITIIMRIRWVEVQHQLMHLSSLSILADRKFTYALLRFSLTRTEVTQRRQWLKTKTWNDQSFHYSSAQFSSSVLLLASNILPHPQPTPVNWGKSTMETYRLRYNWNRASDIGNEDGQSSPLVDTDASGGHSHHNWWQRSPWNQPMTQDRAFHFQPITPRTTSNALLDSSTPNRRVLPIPLPKRNPIKLELERRRKWRSGEPVAWWRVPSRHGEIIHSPHTFQLITSRKLSKTNL